MAASSNELRAGLGANIGRAWAADPPARSPARRTAGRRPSDRPTAGRRPEPERDGDPARPDRPRRGPAPRGVRRGRAGAAGRVAQDAGPAPADPGPLGRGQGGLRHRRGRAAVEGRRDGRDGHDLVHRPRGRTPTILAIQLVENALREDLRPVEQARAFKALIDRNGWEHQRLAAELARLRAGGHAGPGAAEPAAGRPGAGGAGGPLALGRLRGEQAVRPEGTVDGRPGRRRRGVHQE